MKQTEPPQQSPKIEGSVRASEVKRVRAIVDSKPEESLGALRRWMESRPQLPDGRA